MRLSFPHLPLVVLVGLMLVWPPHLSSAREAAFVQPGAAGTKGAGVEALVPEPKELDTGESVSGVARRVTLFFSNQSALPVGILNISVNGDSNVAVETLSDDCKMMGKIPSGSRCSIVLSITPSSPGPWSVEVLITHDGVGRITRAQVNGETLGDKKSDKAATMGLAMSAQKVDPVDFGEVESGGGEAVRTALVSNDSAEDLTVLSIDLVSPNNGLSLMEQGCEIDQTLKTGESCPITLKWTPTSRGMISTDLIVRHTGRVGFIVIPIRGKASGTAVASSDKDKKDDKAKTETIIKTETSSSSAPATITPPPTAQQLDELAKNLPPLSKDQIAQATKDTKAVTDAASLKPSKPEPPDIMLIGTVGEKAILKIGGTTKIMAVGTTVSANQSKIKLLSVSPRAASLNIDGTETTVTLNETRVMVTDSAPAEDMQGAASAASDDPAPTKDKPAPPVDNPPGSTSAP